MDREIVLLTKEKEDYISLTDIARHKNPLEPKDIVQNWMRSKTTIEFLGLWEKLHNPGFKGVEFDAFMYQAGSNSFVLSPSKWIGSTQAIGIITKAGNTGGTYAHKDIAFEFASWVSVEFKLYLIKEFQRLKEDENSRLRLEWNFQRTLARVNYRIHIEYGLVWGYRQTMAGGQSIQGRQYSRLRGHRAVGCPFQSRKRQFCPDSSRPGSKSAAAAAQ